MRYLLPLMALILLACHARAQICPDTPPGYVRQYRPEGEPANYPPVGEPVCYLRDTQEAASYASCILCHSYMQRRLG